MPKASKPAFYAVRTGRKPGIYDTWGECQAQVTGFSAPQFKKFGTHAEAWAYAFPSKPIAALDSTSSTTPKASISAASSLNKAKTPYSRAHTVKASLSHNAFAKGADSDEAGFDVVVYTDGACKNNQAGAGGAGKRAGLGVFFGDHDPRNIAERVPGEQTNNRAELLALVRALEEIPHVPQKIMLKTDSKYSIQCVEVWIHGWIKNGWKTADRKPVANGSVIRYLHALLDERALSGQAVKLVHVAGHAGIEGNEAADQLANRGCVDPALTDEPDWEQLTADVGARKHATVQLVREKKAPAKVVTTVSLEHGGKESIHQFVPS